MSRKIQTSDEKREFIERTYDISISTRKGGDSVIKIKRELLEYVDGKLVKVYRALGVKDAPDFKPFYKITGSQLQAITSFEWTASDGSKRLANGLDLYSIVRDFCDVATQQ